SAAVASVISSSDSALRLSGRFSVSLAAGPSRSTRTLPVPTVEASPTLRRLPPVILENGTIRTLDPTLPTARALAIAGGRSAGGAGTPEPALASPEVVNLGGRCVVPGFVDAHVHFTTWSLAQREVRLEDTRSLDEALARVAGAAATASPGR